MAVGLILKNAYLKEKRQRYGLSLRTLADCMGVSATFLSNVFNDKAALPWERLEDVSKLLNHDSIQKKNLRTAIAKQKLQKIRIEDVSNHAMALDSYSEYSSEKFPLLDQWY